MARLKQSSKRTILWWVFVGWWWYPLKWIFFTLPVALIKKFNAPKTQPAQQKPSHIKIQSSPSAQPATEAKGPLPESSSTQPAPVTKMGVYPAQVNGHPLRYTYVFAFEPLEDVNITKDILAGEEKVVDTRPTDAGIELSLSGRVFGLIQDKRKTEMLFDWERKGFPCHAILLASGNQVNLRFYQDRRIGHEWREQTVVALISFKSESKQDGISFLTSGDELTLSEDYEKECRVEVTTPTGEVVGALPKKAAERFISDGAYAAYFERGEEDEDGVIKPFIHIYW